MASLSRMNFERPVAPDPYSLLPQVASFDVSSTDFVDGASLPQAQLYGGGNASPALSWSSAPQGTAGYAVSCFDPDAPTPCGFWHWFVVGLSSEVTELPAGAGMIGGGLLPEGAVVLSNDFGTRDYAGAAPPAGDRRHRYQFVVHALDTDSLGLTPEDPPAKGSFVMLGHTLGRAILTGTHQA